MASNVVGGTVQTLSAVTRFARAWHRGQWSIGDLPRVINAEMFVELGSGGILGISCRSGDRAIIGIDERVVGTPLYVPVLAHECAHLIIDTAGVHGCTGAVTSKAEQLAWFGATLLAIPDKAIAAYERGERLPRDIAN